jgi:hypothetical protein
MRRVLSGFENTFAPLLDNPMATVWRVFKRMNLDDRLFDFMSATNRTEFGEIFDS